MPVSIKKVEIPEKKAQEKLFVWTIGASLLAGQPESCPGWSCCTSAVRMSLPAQRICQHEKDSLTAFGQKWGHKGQKYHWGSLALWRLFYCFVNHFRERKSLFFQEDLVMMWKSHLPSLSTKWCGSLRTSLRQHKYEAEAPVCFVDIWCYYLYIEMKCRMSN